MNMNMTVVFIKAMKETRFQKISVCAMVVISNMHFLCQLLDIELLVLSLLIFVTSDEEHQEEASKHLSNQEIGLAKLSGFREWFSNHAMIRDPEDTSNSYLELDCQKMAIFAHHLKVLDGIQVGFSALPFYLLKTFY